MLTLPRGCKPTNNLS